VIFVLYFAITTAMLISVGKSGATINYFIEWMCVSSVLIGILVARAVAVSADRPLPALCVGAALLLQVAVPTIWGRSSWGDAARTSHLQALVNRIRAASGPVLSDDMVLLMRAGKPVPLEPAIFSELTATGAWDERPFIAMIRARRFAFIITSGYTGETIYDSRHTAEVSSAIETAYPRTEESAGLVVHLPRG
jgi:hypothetical protein